MSKKQIIELLNNTDSVTATIQGGCSIKFNRIRTGKIKIKAIQYCFSWLDAEGSHDSYGATKDLKENNGGLELVMFNGAIIRYEVEGS